MRHNKKFNHLGRKTGHRKAMLANMATSLILHKRITTTVAKAKALRMYVEPIITYSKNDTTHSRRMAFSGLRNKHAVTELFREVAPRIADRPGGYTRILKTGFRQGDAAEMCFIELVDFNETYTVTAKAAESKTRRSRRGGAKKTAETGAQGKEKPEVAQTKAAPVAEQAAPVEEAPAEEPAEATQETPAQEAPAVEEETKEAAE